MPLEMRRRSRRGVGDRAVASRRRVGAAASFAAGAVVLLAAPRFAGADASAVVAEGHLQGALAVRAGTGALVAKVCGRAAVCTADGGVALPVPDDVAPRLASATVVDVPLGAGRRLARVEVPGDGGGAWVVLVAAPVGPARGAAPLVVWSGVTGVSKGAEGEGRSAAIVVDGDGLARRVLIGERRDDVSLCGRPTLVAVREVDPTTMKLARGATVENLSAADRAAAMKLVAVRLPGSSAPSAAPRLLRATAASSALARKFSTLTDGDPTTTWSEGKPGDGRGEFVTMSSSSEVAITALELVVRGDGDELAEGAAPRTLTLVTPDRLFEVDLREDAWSKPGARFEVKLPEPIRTACLAVVLGGAYARPGVDDPQVTLAEITAHTSFDGALPEGLVGALAGGTSMARGAAAMLERSGASGVDAAIAGYAKLDDAGRELARGVVDGAPCATQVSFFAALLVGGVDADPAARRAPSGERESPEVAHARGRLRRCGRVAAPALAAIVSTGSPRARLVAAAELSLIAPAEAVPVLADAMVEERTPAARRELRAALAHAMRSERALGAVATELAAARLRARSPTAQLDLLRAVGPGLGRVEGGASAFALLAVPNATLRTRYLLLGPAAELALAGDSAAETWLRAALARDPDAHVRARAAEVAGGVASLALDLARAVDDSEPRVREAAVVALAKARAHGADVPVGAVDALARRATADPWTFVRVSAIRALGALPPQAEAERALAAALADASADVRGAAVDGLGAHRARAFAGLVRALQNDEDEQLDVRARAIGALGAMCDASSKELWTKLAHRAASPQTDVDRRLGAAAIDALGELHPADLEERFAPLVAKDAPREVQEMVKAALASRGACR